MDKDTIYNTVSGAVGACLAIIFFLILFGRIDLLGLVEEGSLGKATRIFETRYLSAADAKAHASRFIAACA